MGKTIREACREVMPEVVAFRRDIHAHPEVGMDTVRTAGKVFEQLNRYGISCRMVNDNGVVAEIRGEKGDSDQVVVLRADMDALNTEERTGLPFASTYEGKMHACGHDLHTSMLVGSAKVLNSMKAEFAGTVRFIFQPAEEIGIGAKYMIENAHVTEGAGAVLGLHVEPLADCHTLNVRRGSDWAAVDHFWITIKGTGAHGATPQDGADATIAAAAIALNLQTMVSRECDPMKPLVVTIGSMHSGHAFNIISQEASLEGTCRSFDRDVYDLIPEAMERIAKHTAEALKCSAEVRIDRVCKPLINDDRAYDLLKESSGKVLLSPDDWHESKMAMIGEDFSEYGEYAPVIFGHLGCDGGYPLHSSYVIFKEDAMETGMAVEVQFALDGLEKLNRDGSL
ncbi:MAG: amidohydrolase [Erysipelotrichaceae bacterium]|nr:amidohydrolase [Erysipelotrichaceae bacterium]